MSDQMVDTTQTEPQDLSVKRPRIDEQTEEGDGQTDEQQKTGRDEPPIQTNTDCDSTTTSNQTAEKSPLPDRVIRSLTDLYERKLFWDQVIDHSQNTDVLEGLKKSLTFKELVLEEVIKNKGKGTVVVNCDNELKHLLTKLKFVNECYEGLVAKTKTRINSYQMKDFCKE